MVYFSSHRGRTSGLSFIELLVVVAIIGILATVLTANFSTARNSARNKSIRASLGEVQLALEVYKAQNNQYPAAINSLVPQYIAELPTANMSGNSNCSFLYNTNGSYYKYTAARCIAGASGAATGIQQADEYARCPSTCAASGVCLPSSANFYESLAVYSVGGECQ